MTTAQHPPRVNPRQAMATQAHDPALPAWVRVGCLAWAEADPTTGHARLYLGQLAATLDTTPQHASTALATARARGWVDPTSTARCLVLPGFGAVACEATHR